MKRIFTFLALAAALVAVSCAKEQGDPAEGKAMVSYTIDGPMQVATKAMGTIGSEYTLYYEVRLWDGSALGEALSGDGLSGNKDIAANAWPATVTFDLARGKQYKILFWAQSKTAPAGLYNASNLTAIAINYSKMAASNEECDAFYGSDVITPTGATAASATLYRPFALVNLGTSDAAQFKTASGGCTVGDVKVTVTGALANSFNVATGEPGAGVATNFAPNAAPIDAYDAKTLVVGESSFNYLSAVYVLPAGPSDVIEVAYDIKDNATTPADITSLTVSNVPVHANYRTNITGKLLTGATTYAIGVDQAFAGNTNKVVGPTFANVTALNTYFATMKDNSDNGDINPEEVTLEAIADGETIVLPTIADDVVIRITGTLATGTLNIAYAASGDKPANLSLFVAQLQKLVADITSTHFTLLSGSHITDQADVHTSGSTFVIEQGAKVGTVNIHQGNAEIAGEVAKVAVPAGASADGDGAPVQVFLTDDAAVQQIELKAKSDVVVEQPAENIDVAATEKKVEVLVKAEAAGSSAKAQNGGAIYVKAYADCSVVSDGKSTAEEGSVPSNVTIAEVATDPGTGDPTVKIAASQSGAGTITTANGTVESAVETNVAMIGETKYASFSDAFDAAIAADGQVVIKMINNTKFDIVVNSTTAYKTIPVGKDITLDLNGFNITTSADNKLTALIVNRGTLTITDTSVGAYGTLTHGGTLNWIYDGGNDFSGSYTTNVITNNGTVNLLAGSVINISRGSACYAVDNNSNAVNAVLNVSGGYLEGVSVAVRQFCNSANHNNDVIVSGGEIYGGKSGIWVQLPGSDASSMKRVHLAVTGGVLEGGSYAFYDYSFGDGWDNVNYEITGGKLVGEIYSYKPNYKFVTGGYYSEDPSDYVADGYVSYFDDAAQVWKIKLEDVAQVGDVVYTSLVDAFEAAQAGDEVKMVKNMYIEATVPTPYGNKCGIKQDGEILNGQNYNLYLTTGGDQYTIMTSGGTIKNLTIASGFRAILLMYPKTDVYIDNVTSGPNVCYAINTAEKGNPDARIIATNSTFLGWCSFSLIASASFTNCKFGQGTYYTNTWGRLIKPYVTTTFTDCEFGYNCAEGDKYYLDLSAFQAGQTIKMINCKVGDTVITADNVADLLDGWDESNKNYSFDNSIFEIIQFE